ncbi:MAG: serine hydrolase domain-containing protein, partial [Bacteroidota bacterium]
GGYAITDSLPTVIQILNGDNPANSKPIRSLFQPGIKYQYSGGGTTISQLLLTDVTGRRYEEYMQKEVLQPLGMKNSFFTQPPLSATKELATAYTNGRPVKGKFHVYPEQAAAGLWTTPTDLVNYIIETQLAYEGRSGRVLNQGTTKKRLTPYVDSNAALGVFILRKGADFYFSHNGGNEGFLCTSYGSISCGNGVVIMINGDKFNIINEVLNSVAQVYAWKDFYTPIFKKIYQPSNETLTLYTGNYLLEKDTISIALCGPAICVRQNGQPAEGLKVIFSNATSFSIADIPNAVVEMLFKEGKVSGFQLQQNGQKLIARKIE